MVRRHSLPRRVEALERRGREDELDGVAGVDCGGKDDGMIQS